MPTTGTRTHCVTLKAKEPDDTIESDGQTYHLHDVELSWYEGARRIINDGWLGQVPSALDSLIAHGTDDASICAVYQTVEDEDGDCDQIRLTLNTKTGEWQ